MRNEKTTISLGFKSDVSELNRAGAKVSWLKDRFDQLAHSVKGVADKGSGLRQLSNAPGHGPRVLPSRLGNQHPASRRHSNTDNRVKPNNRPTPGMGLSAFRKLRSVGVGTTLAAGGALGLALTIGNAASKGVTQAKAYMDAISPLNKQLSLLNDNQKAFVGNISETAVSLGIARAELLQYTKAYVGQAGAQNGRIGKQVRDIGYFAKGMGMDKGTTYAQMGGLAQAGAFGAMGGMRAKQFAAMIADAVSSGNMKGREGELLSSINSLVNVQLQTLTRPGGMAGMINLMTGMNRTGQPGLMGARGASVLGRINQGIMNPGAGDYGEMFMYKALGGGGFYDFKMRQEEGAFGPHNNFLRVMGNMRKSFPNGKARWFAMSKLFPGLSMHQVQGLESALGKTGSGSGFIEALTKASGGNPENISTESYGILAQLYNAKDGKERMRVLKGDSRLGGLSNNFTTTSSREAMMRAVAGKSLIQTPEDQTNSQLASINQTLEKGGMEAIAIFSKTYSSVDKIGQLLENHLGALKESAQKNNGLYRPGDMSTINPDLNVPYKPNVALDGTPVKITEEAYKNFDMSFFKNGFQDLKQSSENLNQAANKINGVWAHSPQSGTGNTAR